MTYAYPRIERELHHRLPKSLLKMRDRADACPDPYSGEAIESWMTYEWECLEHGVDPDLDRETLEGMIDASAYYMRRDEHRNGHAEDFVRWGRLGGLQTYKRYGRAWFVMLARRRWDSITAQELVHDQATSCGTVRCS
jgi:hypothetical protein